MPSPVVLIVDDNQDTCEMYAMGLSAMGFQPVVAGNSEDGFARACQYQPEVIVTDIGLPGPSGMELIQRFGRDARTKRARIIILTGWSMSTLEPPANITFDRVLVKPCTPDDLGREIWHVLKTDHGPRPPFLSELPPG